jgi:hypothetical protein
MDLDEIKSINSHSTTFCSNRLEEYATSEARLHTSLKIDKEIWDEVNTIWLDWKYRIGGEKYLESVYLLKV